jgi:hypothetical protein
VLDSAPSVATRALLQPIAGGKAPAADVADIAGTPDELAVVMPKITSLSMLSAEEKANLLRLIAQLV